MPYALGFALLLNALAACPLPAQSAPEFLETLSLDSLLSVPVSAASKYAQHARHAPASVSVVTAAEIARHGYRTLDQVLAAERGFYVSNDRNYSYLGARGFSLPTDYNNRVLLLINGHPFNEIVFGSAPIGTEFGISMEAIERIEIVRGPGSALYGNHAMFAVINLVTRSGRTTEGVEVSAELGSHGQVTGSVAAGTRARNGLDLFGSVKAMQSDGPSLYFAEYDDPATNRGVAENLDWDRSIGAFGSLSYRNLELQARAASRDKGIPTASFETEFNQPDARTGDSYAALEAVYTRALAADRQVVVRSSVHRYRYVGRYPYDQLEYDAADARWLDVEARLIWDLRANHRLSMGGGYLHSWRADYHQWNASTRYFDGDFPYAAASLYVQDEFHPTDWLALTGGARLDAWQGQDPTLTPRVAVVVNPLPSSTLKLLYGEAFRSPNLHEAHYSYPDQHRPNAELRRERIETAEVVWEQRFASWLHGSAAAFHYHVYGLIATTIEPTDSMTTFTNVGRADARGVEVEAQAQARSGVTARLSHTHQRVTEETGDRFTNSPAHLTKLKLAVPLAARLTVGAEVRHEAARGTVYGGTTPAFLLANLNVSTAPYRGLSAAVLVRNVFDTEFFAPGGFEHRQAGIVQDGRTVTVGVRYQF